MPVICTDNSKWPYQVGFNVNTHTRTCQQVTQAIKRMCFEGMDDMLRGNGCNTQTQPSPDNFTEHSEPVAGRKDIARITHSWGLPIPTARQLCSPSTQNPWFTLASVTPVVGSLQSRSTKRGGSHLVHSHMLSSRFLLGLLALLFVFAESSGDASITASQFRGATVRYG